MQRTNFKVAALSMLIGLAPMAAPVHAGSFTIKVTPTGKRADALQKGLDRLSAARARINQARIKQTGTGNSATATQNGSGNGLLVVQRGSGHSATVSQDGDNNRLGVFQFGKNTSTNTTQTGNGESGLIFQGGW
jgi:hypothetical protein